jgi:predicted nucleotidyltransferase
MKSSLENRIDRVKGLINKLNELLEQHDQVIGFIVYGSFSDNTGHKPTKYSDVDLEIIVKDEAYKDFLGKFRGWFESNFEPVLIETHVTHLQKIFVTNDFIDLQFHISKIEDFERIEERSLDYFPNGYSILFDKSNALEGKIKSSLAPALEKTPQQKFDELNSSFWYFIQGTTPFIKRKEYWFCAAGYWAWLYVILCKLLRMYFGKEVKEDSPIKHIEQDLDKEILKKIQPLKNLETPQDLKAKTQLLINIYIEYANKVSEKYKLNYTPNVEKLVLMQIKQYLK